VIERLGDIDHQMIVLHRQLLTLSTPLQPDGAALVVSRITDIFDAGRSALIVLETSATEPRDGLVLWHMSSTIAVRGEGGFGGTAVPAEPDHHSPDKPPMDVVRYRIRDDQALLYRLCGDRNRLHCDPAVARSSGFERPILHGLCTLGFAGRALLRTFCDLDPARFGTMSVRFSRPVYPGDELAVELWEPSPGSALFRASTGSGVVLDDGRFTTATPRSRPVRPAGAPG
jgi:acyl dehydratase